MAASNKALITFAAIFAIGATAIGVLFWLYSEIPEPEGKPSPENNENRRT